MKGVGEYCYQIRAYDAAGNYSDWTDYKSFSVTKVSDNVPMVSNLSYQVVNGQIVCDWDDINSGNITGYQVLRTFPTSTKTGGLPPTPDDVSESYYTMYIPSYTSGEQYISVRAVGKNGLYSKWVNTNTFSIFGTQEKKFDINFGFDGSGVMKISSDNFVHQLTLSSSDCSFDLYSLPENICRIIGSTNGKNSYWNLVTDTELTTARQFISASDNDCDVFFANAKGTWKNGYVADHHGTYYDWGGTDERVSLKGKNKLTDIFYGSTDANVLIMTDDENGDALFLDDVYSSLGTHARMSQIKEIRAGAGDDLIDLTSQRFSHITDGVTVYGGLGDDTIWANGGYNILFGDAGNDRIVGSSNYDVIVGGLGNDSLHGGGGNDAFCFGGNWGHDTVEQVSGDSVILWFEEDCHGWWDESNMIFTDGTNSVKVNGTSAKDVAIYYGNTNMVANGAFADFVTEKIFEYNSNKAALA